MEVGAACVSLTLTLTLTSVCFSPRSLSLSVCPCVPASGCVGVWVFFFPSQSVRLDARIRSQSGTDVFFQGAAAPSAGRPMAPTTLMTVGALKRVRDLLLLRDLTKLQAST